jgi:hypothetical protein
MMLATDITVLDTVINKVVQTGDSVHRIGTDEALETFQSLVDGNPFLAYVSGREVSTVEYGLTVSAMAVCTCVFTWAGGEANHYQDRTVCTLAPYEH